MSLKKFTIGHYIRYVRRQNKHIQHLHAVVFAGTVTALVGAFILYTDYGFWHERYVAEDLEIGKETSSTPGERLGAFWQEAKERFEGIGTASSGLLEGKETYEAEQDGN